jgi:hypothetical protein
MAKVRVTDEFLDQLETWAIRRLTAEEFQEIALLIREMRRLRKRIEGNAARPAQCEFTRRIAGHHFRCAAAARYGRFCGYHKPRQSKQRSKGCIAKNRDGAPCKAIVLSDELCPTHWQKVFGHDYKREGKGFRCALCDATFDYWTVEGKGRDRTGSIKRVARCPAKVQPCL